MKLSHLTFCAALAATVAAPLAAHAEEPRPVKPNLKWDVTIDRVTWTKNDIADGNTVRGYANKFIEPPPEGLVGDVARVIALYEGERLLHRHVYKDTFDGKTFWAFYLVPDPESEEDKVFRKDWTGDFARALAALPPGKHALTVKGWIQQGERSFLAVLGTLNYDNTTPSGVDVEALAKAIDQNRGRDPQAELMQWMEANGGIEAWRAHNAAAWEKREAENAERDAKKYYYVTLENKCSKSVTVQSSNGQTIIMDGYGKNQLRVMRGSTASLTIVNGGPRGSVSESAEGSTIVVCP